MNFENEVKLKRRVVTDIACGPRLKKKNKMFHASCHAATTEMR